MKKKKYSKTIKSSQVKEPEENYKAFNEWMYQADYDYETARAMFKSKRYVYCIFMCHLSLEKAFKGLLHAKQNVFPSKTHNLLYLVEKLKLQLPEEYHKFVFTLNDVSIPTRYPEDLRKLIRVYTKTQTQELLLKTKELLQWIKEQ